MIQTFREKLKVNNCTVGTVLVLNRPLTQCMCMLVCSTEPHINVCAYACCSVVVEAFIPEVNSLLCVYIDPKLCRYFYPHRDPNRYESRWQEDYSNLVGHVYSWVINTY